jgi:hypothetical protein
MWKRNVTSHFHSLFAHPQRIIIVLMLVLGTTGFAIPWSRHQTAVAAGLPSEVWVNYSQTFIFKDKQITISFQYPNGWEVIAHPDSYMVHVQNVAPFDNVATVPGGIPNGFAKISFMFDPKANPAASLSGEDVSINGTEWKQTLGTGEGAGDRSVTLETVQDGVVFRVYTYIVGTGGDKALLDHQAATLDKMVASLTVDSVIPLDRPPDAPPAPVNGKPKTP